jgi:hypothetical protein
MRQAFHIAVIALVGFLMVDRAVMHSQAGTRGTVSCAYGAQIVKANALRRGFSEAGAASQGEAFMSSCLVSGGASVGDLIARD